MNEAAPRVAILGGGTAGWMAAALFARAWPRAGIDVIEAPDIGIIGVGEGSTPQLKAFFDRLGIAEREWMPRCNATYKTGIAFHGWSRREGAERYFHPFTSMLDVHSAGQFFANARARRGGVAVDAHPDRYFVPARLAAERRGPIAHADFPFDVTYGYHFDSSALGQFLRDFTVARGVRHVPRRIVEMRLAEDGNVSALIDEAGTAIEADLFVDCSGFASVIAQQALGLRFHSYADNLFNDSAVVCPTPRVGEAINAHTISTTMTAGWVWNIPLQNRTGNGYVYSSRYQDAGSAEAELRAHLGLGDDAPPMRHLKMKVGRLEQSWSGNCLAVGLAQGFIEPLEATALHLVQATVEGFIAAWEQGDFTPRHRDRFNTAIAGRFDGVRDYIVCHYRVNQRRDTPYWRDNGTNDALSDPLRRVLHCWTSGGDLGAEIERLGIARYYSAISWHCLLSGYGLYPDTATLRAPSDPVDFSWLDGFIAACARNFDYHHLQLARLR